MPPLRAVTSDDWPGPRDEPPPDPLLVLLHGYGANEHDLVPLVPMLPGGLPWASLRAPLEMGHGGAAWFPLGLDLSPEPDPGVITAVTAAVWGWLDDHAPAGAPVVPVGFSQGGFMALQLLRTRPARIAATVVLAGFTSPAPQPADAALAEARPPVFWGRGTADGVVPEALVRQTSAWLANHADVRERVYPGLAHGISEEQMADARAYLAECGVAQSAE